MPLACNVRTARDGEAIHALALIDKARARGFAAGTAAMDKGYDVGPIYHGCEERDCRPTIPLRHRVAIERGDHKPPTCEHGDWRFVGSDSKSGASKWRWPSGECKPAVVWIKADRLHPLVPRNSPRFTALTVAARQSSGSSGGSRTNGRLLRSALRGLDRVRLHADLTILAKLATALARARAALAQRGPSRGADGRISVASLATSVESPMLVCARSGGSAAT
jgi:hypothetical protein